MRHRKRGRKFGRQSAQRNALRRDVVMALFLHGRIVTTVPRAKEFRSFAERLITVARKAAPTKDTENHVVWLNAYRRLLAVFGDENVVVKLLDEIGPSFADRPGGYTRILRIARGRLGDNAPTAVFELVTFDPLAGLPTTATTTTA